MRAARRGAAIPAARASAAGPGTRDPYKLALYALLAVTCLSFGCGITGSFHFDDLTLFSDPAVTSASGLWAVWAPLRTRPVTFLSFWINYQLGGNEPFGYHLLNLALHLLAVTLLFGLLRRLTGDRAALIASALFALHPIQVEPVLYVFERASLLGTVFCLLSMKAWVGRRYWIAAAWFALALLSKEECVAFPLFLLLLWRAWLPAACMLGMSALAGARVLAAIRLLHITGAGALAGVSPFDYLSTQGVVILRYFRLLLVPYGFSIDPDVSVVHGWLGWLAWAAIVLAALAILKYSPGGKWFLGGLLLLAPSSSVFPAIDLAADRRLYLPMIAFAAFGGLLLARLRARVLVPVAAALACISAMRTQVWLNERTLWGDALDKAPGKLRPYMMLARNSEPDAALSLLRRAEQLQPGDPVVASEVGLALLRLKAPEQALAEFERALAREPGNPEFLNDRAVALDGLGRRSEAIADFRKALGIDPCRENPRVNLERLGAGDSLPVCVHR